MSNLYIVATPLGNLNDLSQRALGTFKEVDLILSEDTRTTKKILHHFQISTPIESYHQHSDLKKIDRIIEKLEKGFDLALVSEAGTPAISDPGSQLVAEITKRNKDVQIVPIPGPCAVAAALSVSGFYADNFLFLGFPPAKKKRQKFFKELAQEEKTIVLYESPHRLEKTLADLTEVIDSRKVMVIREMTKQFETTYRGRIDEVTEQIKNDQIKGEFVIVINRKK